MTGNYEKLYFIDSNIWLYALVDNQEVEKREVACKLVDDERIVISTQVINEVCINLIKKSTFNEMQLQQLIRSFYDGCGVVELRNCLYIDMK